MPSNFGDEISKLKVEPLKPQAKAQTKSNYIIQHVDKTTCPQCRCKVDLLCRKDCNTDKPWFYICWYCEFIAEVGKGEVPREE